jgi:branched-chain amino acid transport system substrate-binding protein
MGKVELLAVVLALVAIVVSASSLYYSISFMGAVGRIDEIQDDVKDVQDDVKDVQGKVDDLWKEVFGKPTPPPTPPPPPLTGQIFKVGVVMPLSGPSSPFGLAGKRGVEWAAEEINAAGGILGAFVQVFVEDCAGDPKIGVSATEKLITVDKCQVIRGAFSSTVIYSMMEVTEKYEIPFLTIGGIADPITQRGYKYIFRICENITSITHQNLVFIADVFKPKNIVIMHENKLMGVTYAQVEQKLIQEKYTNWQLLSVEPYDSSSLDFRPMLEKVRALNPDCVIINPYLTDIALIIKQMREMGWKPKLFVSGGVVDISLITMLGKDGEGLFLGYPWWGGDRQWPDGKAIREKCIECWNRYGRPFDEQLAQGYLGTYILKAAIEKCKSLDPKAIREALSTLEISIPWFGTVKFYPNGQLHWRSGIVQIQKARPDEPWNVEGLTFHHVYPPEMASAAPIL